MDSPLALYRRYRPETFSQVIGQDHVTQPLRNALANDRVNHAYLFSGPRGCGKTTSARILARTLNCAQAPTAEPCGECDSCRDLATGGGGSIDVIEIDAASHGGVDDARDLREKAFFAPVRDRFKIYIIDEAHMVSNQGFNALLKLVEEPPPHLRFIFATTEPEKVIPTIRSRTHHYPFRLIPPRMLSEHVSDLCAREGVAIEPAAVPLVVRAGAGSARDTLSVLDQLIGGAGPEGVTHRLAVALLGFTPDTLLDEIVDAFAASDGAAVFGVVDKVIESGQDPRRFAEDLLRRLRDLVIVAAVPDAPTTGLIDVSQDQGERLAAQAARFGGSDLSRAADILAAGLMDMKGAISPRLLLELICARVLLPGADHTTDGVQARLDRMEKRFAIGAVPTGDAQPPSRAPQQQQPTQQSAQYSPQQAARQAVAPPAAQAPPSAAPAAPTTAAQAPAQEPVQQPQQQPQAPAPAAPTRPAQPAAASEPAGWGAPAASATPPGQSASQAPASAPDPSTPTNPPGAPTGGLSLVDVRRLWPDVVDAVRSRRRLAWMLLTQNAQVTGVDGNTLTLGFNNAGARESFVKGGSDLIVREAAIDVIGVAWNIDAVVDPGVVPGGAGPAYTVKSPAVKPTQPAQAQPDQRQPERAQADLPQSGPAGQRPQPGRGDDGGYEPPPPSEPPDDDGPPPPPESYDRSPAAQQPPVDQQSVRAAREAIQQTRNGEMPKRNDDRALADAAVSRDDPDAESQELDSAELLKRTLGARVIEEIKHQ
ncbi:DNA polymerase III subunit gamma and tau [Nocardioides jishulii]|uniref:DNA polymerase III subunit gamma/tau n=1 Tax=Nocardioides jishulii TaxID=2575440 RepID=A0A4U2YS58_9ACTN|nr:DNA polymerase III subunit gamma and tau [Nocardioides jishulii]QCX28844.1 DNA polymerase III subunit gamma and tau [Nocardioides jishulii]TKI64259.1 DNA polymerase III subunit gamma and tau [Nocardioides jishulii]